MKLLVPYSVTDANFVSSTIAENDYPALVINQAYTVGTRVIYQHRIYEALTSTITNWAPASAPTEWLDIGPTNRWAMFDEAVGTSSSATTTFTTVFSVTGAINDIVLLNVVATSVQVTVPGATRTVPITQTAGGITVSILNLAGTGAGNVTIVITGTGTVSVGSVCAGNYLTIGDTDWGTTVGLTDLGTKSFDAYGNPMVNANGYQRTLQARFSYPMTQFDTTEAILTAVRSTPVLWSGIDTLSSMLVFGFYKDWSLTVDNYARYSGTVQVESLMVTSP